MEMTNVGNLLELRRIYSRGITGKGITTAVLDTGIYAHPDFFIPQNKILYFQDFVRNRRGPNCKYFCWNARKKYRKS